MDKGLDVDPTLDVAVRVEKATFEWEESAPQETVGGGKKYKKSKSKQKKAGKGGEDKKSDAPPFKIKDVGFDIPRGQLVAIVGPVGSGKVCL